MDRLTELRDTVAFLQAELEAIHTGAADRSLTDDENLRFTEGEFVRNAAIAEGIELEARAASIAAVRSGDLTVLESGDSIRSTPAFHREVDPYDERYQREVGTREAALRAIGEHRSMDDDAKGESERKLNLAGSPEMRGIDQYLLAHGSNAYASGWFKMVSNRAHELSDAERGALAHAQSIERAMSLTDGSGGYLIPIHLDPTVILTNAGSKNPFRAISRVVSVTGDTWGGITSAGITASWDGEGVEVSDDAPAFQNPTITPAKAAAFVPISIEAYEDIAGAGTEIARMFADAKDRLESTAFATGSAPVGVVTALAAEAVGAINTFMATNGAIAAADLFKAHNALGSRYEDNATWVMNKAYLNRIRVLGATDNFYAQTVPLQSGGPTQLLGSNVVLSSDMTAAITTGTNNAVVYGDFSNYVIVDRIGMGVELIPHLFHTTSNFPSGQRGIYTHWRTGADVVNNSAFVHLINPNTAVIV